MPTAYAPLDEEGKWYFHAYLHDPMYSWVSCEVRMRVANVPPWIASMDYSRQPFANARMKMHYSVIHCLLVTCNEGMQDVLKYVV